MKKGNRVTGIVLLVLTLLLAVGTATVFGACGPKEDGTFMTCHWAGRAVTGVAAVLAVIAAARLLIRDAGMQAGLSAAAIPAAVLVALIPGRLIAICGSAAMKCHTGLQYVSLVLGVLIAVAAAADVLMSRRDA